MVIFESPLNVPSLLMANDPLAPFAVSTASDGRFTPTSCSRTLMVAFVSLPIVHVLAPVAVVLDVAAAVAAGVVVAVCVGVGALAAPPQAARRMAAAARTYVNRTTTRSRVPKLGPARMRGA